MKCKITVLALFSAVFFASLASMNEPVNWDKISQEDLHQHKKKFVTKLKAQKTIGDCILLINKEINNETEKYIEKAIHNEQESVRTGLQKQVDRSGLAAINIFNTVSTCAFDKYSLLYSGFLAQLNLAICVNVKLRQQVCFKKNIIEQQPKTLSKLLEFFKNTRQIQEEQLLTITKKYGSKEFLYNNYDELS